MSSSLYYKDRLNRHQSGNYHCGKGHLGCQPGNPRLKPVSPACSLQVQITPGREAWPHQEPNPLFSGSSGNSALFMIIAMPSPSDKPLPSYSMVPAPPLHSYSYSSRCLLFPSFSHLRWTMMSRRHNLAPDCCRREDYQRMVSSRLAYHVAGLFPRGLWKDFRMSVFVAADMFSLLPPHFIPSFSKYGGVHAQTALISQYEALPPYWRFL